MQSMEIVSEEQVLGAVKSNGPVVPMDIRQILKYGDSITIGATLSTLSARGLVLITHIKRGGSPFYYIKGQEDKLETLSKFLNEKDRRTFDVLKEKKVMRDKDEDPLMRISLRNMPDFAKKISLNVAGVEEIAWYWYMLSEEEAKLLLNETNSVFVSKEKEEEIQKPKAEKKKEEIEETVALQPEKQELKQEQKEPKVKKERKSRETQEKKREQESQFLEVREDVQQKLNLTNPSQLIAQFNDSFMSKIGAFLLSSNILIKEIKQIKKSAEYDLVIDVPTPVGNIEYFCKVKSKKKCNEADLSSAYIQGQNMRLPVLFLTTGEIVKKTKEKLNKDFKGMIIKEVQ